MRPLTTTLVASALAGAAASAGVADTGETLRSDLINAQGASIGEVTVIEADYGMIVEIQAEGLEPGPHGVHLHEFGDCSTPAFGSAGGHISVGDQVHGLMNEDGPHDGDLANVYAGEDGKVAAQLESARVPLRGAHRAFLDNDGGALVIHADADDHISEDGGGSGERVACAAFQWTEQPSDEERSEEAR